MTLFFNTLGPYGSFPIPCGKKSIFNWVISQKWINGNLRVCVHTISFSRKCSRICPCGSQKRVDNNFFLLRIDAGFYFSLKIRCFLFGSKWRIWLISSHDSFLITISSLRNAFFLFCKRTASQPSSLRKGALRDRKIH